MPQVVDAQVLDPGGLAQAPPSFLDRDAVPGLLSAGNTHSELVRWRSSASNCLAGADNGTAVGLLLGR